MNFENSGTVEELVDVRFNILGNKFYVSWVCVGFYLFIGLIVVWRIL